MLFEMWTLAPTALAAYPYVTCVENIRQLHASSQLAKPLTF